MSNFAVIYATKTGHSQKLAESIGAALNTEVKNINVNPQINDADLLFVVGGIYGGNSMPELLEFIKKLDAPLPKYAAIITNCASGRQSQIAVRDILEKKGVIVIDEFICRGNFLFVSIKHPNAKDLKEAEEFALRISRKIG